MKIGGSEVALGRKGSCKTHVMILKSQQYGEERELELSTVQHFALKILVKVTLVPMKTLKIGPQCTTRVMDWSKS